MKKTTSFRLLGLFLVMFAMSQPSQASQSFIDTIRRIITSWQESTRNHALVTVTSVGEGKVYVKYNTDVTPAESDWDVEMYDETTPPGVSSEDNQTFYLHAKANGGYTFVGWWKNENCTGKAESTANPYAASVTVDYGYNLSNDNTKGRHHYWAKFVPLLTVNLNANGYATFASPVALDFTDSNAEYTAWAITAVNSENKFTFEQITTTVAPGTGILLMGEAGAKITLTEAESGETLSDNLLVGFTEDTAIAAGEYYGLKGKTFVKGAAGTVKACKALLPANLINEDAATVKGINIDLEEDATGIQEIENAVEDGAIYNMAGQRLNKMQKGINIVNGKKILKK